MVDLHTHVLPGLDDGPKGLDGSLAMARVAAGAGTRVMVATPHVRDDHPRVRPDEIRERTATLQDALSRSGIDIRVVSGAEVDIGMSVDLSDDALRELTLDGNDRDLLVETPYGELPSVFEDLVLGLGARGFRVTLAHPERSPTLQRAVDPLGRLVEGGALVQVTASSFTASRRSPSRAVAREALVRGWVHAIASDGHSAERRGPDMTAGLRAAGRTVPDDEIRWLVDASPRAILSGAALPPRPARPARRRFGRRRS